MTDPIDVAADALAREIMLRRERVPAVVINMTISIMAFFLIFGWAPAAATALAIDFVPQTLGITALGGLVPAMIMRRRIATGAIRPAGPTPAMPALLARIGLCALVALVVGAGLAAALTLLFSPPIVAPAAGLALKAAYGGLLGLIVTPPVLRMTLGMPPLGEPRNAVTA